MISLDIKERIDPDEVVNRMNDILCKYYNNVNSCSNLNMKKEDIKGKDKVSCVNNKGSCIIQGGKRRKTQKNVNK